MYTVDGTDAVDCTLALVLMMMMMMMMMMMVVVVVITDDGVQACCQDSHSNSSCCTGVYDERSLNVTCPCKSCWDKVAMYIDKGVKAAGGIGLFFSFTEVTTTFACVYM